MIFVFTLVVTIFSFAHLERFDLHRLEAWIWFVLYVGVCINAGVHLWLYRQLPPPDPTRPQGVLRVLLSLEVLLLGAYGLALLVAPAAASSFWPWKLDTFHAQLYSVTFLTPAAGALSLLRSATRIDWFTLGITQLAWGLLPILALVIVDIQVRRVDWLAWPLWLWIGLFAMTAAMGVWMLRMAASASVTAS